jgi:hypothetical protein
MSVEAGELMRNCSASPIFAAMQNAFPARQCGKILSSAWRRKPMRRREFITLLG